MVGMMYQKGAQNIVSKIGAKYGPMVHEMVPRWVA